MTAAVQTLWAELIAAALADTGVRICVVSPGSRSTPLVAALVADGRLDLPTIIDERSAAFYALGVARATNVPCALVCTSGSAAAHYLPAIVEAHASGIPLIALTADRPPELHHCGASQTIDQIGMYGHFVRVAFDLGGPTASELAFRAVRRTIVQAVTASRGPRPGPVHINVPLRKPLEPAAPTTDTERALATLTAELRRTPVTIAVPRLTADRAALDGLAAAIAAEPNGVILAGAMPVSFAASRETVFELARRAGYSLLAEAGSQLRFGPRPSAVTAIDHVDLALASTAGLDREVVHAWKREDVGLGKALAAPTLMIQLGAEPVAQAWPGALAQGGGPLAACARWVLTDEPWRDPDGTARMVIAGDVGEALAYLVHQLAERPAFGHNGNERHRSAPCSRPYATGRYVTKELASRASRAMECAIESHPRSETAMVAAALEAMPEGAIVQLGNSLPIRVVDHVKGGGTEKTVITQRGAAGIDGLVASAAGATCAGKPVLVVLGDVSFAHDVSGLLAARDEARAPLAILVIDNGGGRIFDQLPYSKVAPPAAMQRHWTTPTRIDPAAVATAFGLRAITAASPAAVSAAIASALAAPGVTVVHAPVSATGAQDVRRTAIEILTSEPIRTSAGASHV